MASAYSILRNFGDYIQPFDFNLIQKGLEYKQQKFDANSTLIQEQINQFSNLELAKDEDKAYLSERLNTLVSQVNEHEGIDLSSNGVTRNIQNHLKQVLDKNIMNAYAGTQNLKKYQEEVAYYKKEKPDLYSQVNEMYGMQGAISWLNDGQAGTQFKGSNYTPFVDVTGKMDKLISDMAKNRPEQSIEFPTNDGRLITKKVKELNAEEIRSVASSMLGNADRQQLGINGWYNFGKMNPELSKKVLTDYSQERVGALEGQIASLELKKQQGVTGIYAQELDDQISFLRTQKNNFETRVNNVRPTSDAVGTFLEEEKLVNGLVSKNQFKEVEIGYETDSAYWSAKDFDYKLLKDQKDYDLALRKQDFDEYKFQVEQKLVSAKDTKGNPIDTGVTQTSRVTDYDMDEINPEEMVFKNIETSESQRQAVVEDFYDNLDPTTQGKFDKTLEAHRLLPENENKTDSELKTDVALSLSNNGQNSQFMNLETYSKLKDIDNNIKLNKQVLTDALDKSRQGLDKQVGTLLDVVKNNPGIRVMVEENGKNKLVSYASYLKSKGLDNPDALNKNKVEKQKFVTTAFTDMLLSNVDEFKDGDKTELSYYLQGITSRLGEQVPIDKMFKVVDEVYRGGIRQVVKLNKDGKNVAPRTYELLRDSWNLGNYDSPSFRDNSFNEDNDSKEILGFKKNKLVYEDELKKSIPNLPQNKQVNLSPESVAYKEAINLAGTGFVASKESTISVYEDPNDNNKIIIQQIQKSGSGAKQVVKPETVSIVKSDIKPGSQLSKVINMNGTQKLLTTQNMRPIIKKNINFADDNNLDYLEGLQTNILGGNTAQLQYASKQGAIKSLYSNYGAFYTNKDGSPSDLGKVANAFVNNPNPFILKASPNNRKTSINLEVGFNNNRGDYETLDVVPLNTTEFDSYQKSYDTAPQIYLYLALDQIMKESIQESIQTGSNIQNDKLNKLKKLYNIN